MPPRFALVPAAYVYLLRPGPDGEEVLLQLRRGTGYMDGHWVAGAAGHVEPGETAAVSACREVREELGVDLDPSALRPVTVMQRTDGSDDPIEQRVDWFFTAREWTGTPTVREAAKCAGIAWHPLHTLPSPVPRYERAVLDGLASGVLPIVTSDGFVHVDFTGPSCR